MKRREKKSESLDIRLPYQQKQEFMAATRQRGETASQALRRFIATYIEEARLAEHSNPVQEITMTLSKHRLKTLLTAASAAAGVFAFTAMPSAADDSAFAKLDANKDGVLTAGEIAPGADDEFFAILDKDGSGTITPDEFESEVKLVSVTRVNDSGEETEDGKNIRKEVKVFKISADGGDASDDHTIMLKKLQDDIEFDGDISEADIQIIVKELRTETSETESED